MGGYREYRTHPWITPSSGEGVTVENKVTNEVAADNAGAATEWATMLRRSVEVNAELTALTEKLARLSGEVSQELLRLHARIEGLRDFIVQTSADPLKTARLIGLSLFRAEVRHSLTK
jgi:hypothetical protein